jgi:hypothetical protein
MRVYVDKKDYLSTIHRRYTMCTYLVGLINAKNKEIFNLCVELIEFDLN